MAQYPGKYCQILKITSKNLIRNHIQKIPIKQITNGLLVELIRYQNRQKMPAKTLLKWLELLYGQNWPKYPPAELTLLKSLSTLYQKHRRLVIHRNSEKLNDFCLSIYCLPKSMKVPVERIATQESAFKKTEAFTVLPPSISNVPNHYQRTSKRIALKPTGYYVTRSKSKDPRIKNAKG